MAFNDWEVVIGLETHTQLATASKIFSGASTAFGAPANSQASVVDLALPGTLPVLNRAAVECAIRFGLAVGGQVAPRSIFARKNYFYPDLPKGYQISQYETPVVSGGAIGFVVADRNGELVAKTVKLTRAHLEEDAGKSLHEDKLVGTLGRSELAGLSGIDLNRAGTPLLEIVSEPEMRSSAEAVAYARTLHALVMWIGICDGNMQEGSFRCDANVSVRRHGAERLGTRREIKNLNSFRFLQQAIEYETQWQINELEDGRSIQQATVLFDPDTGETRTMRTKEDAMDYRYFPDPDLMPLEIVPAWVERVRASMPELPGAMRERFQRDYGLPAYDAQTLTASLATARYYEAVAAKVADRKVAANWVMGDVAAALNDSGTSIEAAPVPPERLAHLIARVLDKTIGQKSARELFKALWAGEGDDIDAMIESRGLRQMQDTGALETLLDEVIAANAKSVEEFRAGKEKAFNALVGQAMKATKGKADPAAVNDLLRRKLAL